MVDIPEQASTEDHHADLYGIDVAGPVIGRCGTVACQPASNASRIANLKGEGEDPEDDMYGRHARIEEKRSKEGAVDVMDRLDMRWVLAFMILRPRGLRPYKQRRHEPISSREVLNPVLLW